MLTGTGEQVSAAYADVDGLKGASVGAQNGKEPGQELIDGADDISADALLKRVRHVYLWRLSAAV